MRPRQVAYRLLTLGLLFIASCAPKSLEGITYLLPEGGFEALQVNGGRLVSCRVGGNQKAKVTRETYYDASLGSAGSERTDLLEVSVSDRGSCNRPGGVFLKRKEAKKLQKGVEGVPSSTPEGRLQNFFVPIKHTPIPVLHRR